MFFKDYVRKWVKRDPVRYNHLHASMISARVGMTVEQYLWRSIKISLAIGVVFGILGYVLSSLVTFQMTGRPGGIYNVLNLPVPDLILGISTVYYAQALLVLFSLIFGVYISYTALLKLPGMEKDSRKTKINLTLHNAVSYMYAMRRGGAQMMPIFRSIAERSNIYGEIALEFRQIVRDTDFFGYDVLTAIRHLSETTPSEKLKDFLEDLLSVIESGGDMGEFLSMRVRLYQEEAKFEQKQFLNTLSLIAESYVTLFVAGPLFLIIIMVVMGMMGGSAVLQLALVTYAVLPIGSIIFILFIDIISIQGEKTSRYVKTRILRTYENVPVIKKGDERVLFRQLGQYDRIRDLIRYLRNPFETFINNVNHTLYITVPVACIYVILIIVNTPNYANLETFINVVDDHLIIALLIVLIPYAIFYQLWSRRVLGIQELIPDFLERMAGINQVGLTIAQAIAIMVNTNLGLLSYEIRRIKQDMEWGGNFSEALVRFEKRISTPSIARTVTLITKASEMSGQIGEVLTIAASDAKMSEVLKRERLAEMFIYTAIIYISFFVFLFVVAVMASQFLPVLASVPTKGLPTSGVLSGIGTVPLDTIKRLLYHACLMQALFSGLIAGQMGESSVAAGVKHACVLLIISLIAFNFVII